MGVAGTDVDSLRIVYAGTPDFAVPALQALIEAGHAPVAVYTQPDRPAGRGRKLRPGPVKQVAEAGGLPVVQPESLKSAEAQAELAAWRPDILVVAAYGLILPRAVLAIPPLGGLNIHASLLPRWRGAAPIHRAILEGDAETGVCLMQMAPGLDTGPVHACRRVPITPETTTGSLHDVLARAGAELLVEQLPMIAAGESAPWPQDDTQATYARKLEKQEAWMDWSQPAAALDRQVRAFNPWPVAQAGWQGQALRVYAATPLSAASDASPGTILRAGPEGVDVATGDGVLRLQAVQLPGRRAVAAADWARNADLVGETLTGAA
ncbi:MULTISPECIES: methionyl-tRNA formyltransferase [unclassified Thioalkalivibrio]|uniref:methionyl-tRNA formyltransferase n=1 Tax=unclassified Thioalkalivibrio TaxID=2621013 RepID=UPI0003623B7D|nr:MULTISPECIES: methionyl-tRNA formyltransferase [unclassified Thioalkalivibrio]